MATSRAWERVFQAKKASEVPEAGVWVLIGQAGGRSPAQCGSAGWGCGRQRGKSGASLFTESLVGCDGKSHCISCFIFNLLLIMV